MCDAAPLTGVLVCSQQGRPDRQIATHGADRHAPSLTAPESSDTRMFTGEGRCLDSRSSSDLTSGGDLSKAHPNYQTPTRGQAMQVVTRGSSGSGKARCCYPRSAWVTTPTRLAKTPGHLGSKALARRFPWSCHERRRHRYPQDLGITGPVPEGSVPCPQSHGHARNAGIALTARQSGSAHPVRRIHSPPVRSAT
jgi:hypothetical protein